MPRQTTKHSEVLEAIRRTASIAELVEEHHAHFKYELELEVIVYGRNYAGKKVGPYVRLLTFDEGEEIIRQGDIGSNTFFVLVDGTLDVYVSPKGMAEGKDIGLKIAELEPDTSFGEMAILAGVPRNATVVVPPGKSAQVLEFSRPALRLLRKLERFGDRLDRTYRDHGLGRTLEDLRQATGDVLDRDALAELRGIAHFSIYGKNHQLLREGGRIKKVLLIKNGWIRRVRGVPLASQATDVVLGINEGEGVDFLGTGNCLGLEAFAQISSAKTDEISSVTWGYTATVMARTEIIEIPLDQLAAHPRLRESLIKAFGSFSNVDDDARIETPRTERRALLAAEKEIATGIVDGTNVLVMDMDLCVRCGNCSLACHKVHGQSRLLRRGIHIERPRIVANEAVSGANGLADTSRSLAVPLTSSVSTQHVLSPSVCMHCQDPECLTGCPTGAIGWKASGEIDITPSTCIGCGDCATQCPYNAISMVPRDSGKSNGGRSGKSNGRGDAKGKGADAKEKDSPFMRVAEKMGALFRLTPAPLPAPVTETENLLAVKCNLCNDTGLNPPGRHSQAYSCQENCPTGALVRVNPRTYFTEVGRTLGVVFQDGTHAVGRNIHRRDPLARLWHTSGTIATLALTVATIYGLMRFGFDTPLVAGSSLSTWLTMRWLTGIVGLVGIAGVMTYPLRKQVYRRRAGALRYWMLAHVYLGTVAGILILLHGGTRTGGLLTTALMISFDLVILSGLFGILSYIISPRIMTSIEGEPLLIEDLQARQLELRHALAESVANSNAEVREIITHRARKRFFTLSYLLRHYIRHEPLTAMLAHAREEFEPLAERLTDVNARRSLMEAIETIVTLRRVDSLIYLHKILKIWVAPHVVSTALMLALMIVHIIQVVFFHVR